MTAPSERDVEAFSSAIVEASLQVSDGMRPVPKDEAVGIARWMLWGGDDNPPLLDDWMTERDRQIRANATREILTSFVIDIQDILDKLEASDDQD